MYIFYFINCIPVFVLSVCTYPCLSAQSTSVKYQLCFRRQQQFDARILLACSKFHLFWLVNYFKHEWKVVQLPVFFFFCTWQCGAQPGSLQFLHTWGWLPAKTDSQHDQETGSSPEFLIPSTHLNIILTF